MISVLKYYKTDLLNFLVHFYNVMKETHSKLFLFQEELFSFFKTLPINSCSLYLMLSI